MAGSFGEAFLSTPHGPRVVALEIPRGYRDASAEERRITLVKYVACASCEKRGCVACSSAGWTAAELTATVSVPAGATPGTRLPIEGHQDVVAEIVQPGPRADELRATESDYAHKLTTAWEMDRSVRRRGRRHVKVVAAAVVALFGVGLVGNWLAKPAAGEACLANGDCRSGMCIHLMTVTPSGPRLDGMMCTASCRTDLDCPGTMHCAKGEESATTSQYVLGTPPGLACIPRGY